MHGKKRSDDRRDTGHGNKEDERGFTKRKGDEQEEEKEKQEEDHSPRKKRWQWKKWVVACTRAGGKCSMPSAMLRKRGVGKSTVAPVDGECWRVRTNETKSPGFASISEQGNERGKEIAACRRKGGNGRTSKRTNAPSERTRTSEQRNGGMKVRRKRYKVTKQAGEPRYGMRCVHHSLVQRQPRQAEAVLVLVVIVALYLVFLP